jgi:peptidyl-prolyl cis-trans isomerase D
MQGKEITSMMASIAQLQNAREVVSWAFNENTKVDDISDVYTLNNMYVIAAIRGMKQKGQPKLDDVREAIETELKATKKLELIQNTITEKLNSGTTLKQIADDYQSSFQDSVKLIFNGEAYQNRNVENTAIGKIFAQPVAKPVAISGKNTLFVVSIYEHNEAGEPTPGYAMEKQSLRNVVAGRGRTENAILDGLKEKATILDQRYIYFSR